MNNKMITIPYADAIEYGENTSTLFKAVGADRSDPTGKQPQEASPRLPPCEGGHRRKGQGGASDYDQGICGYDRLLLQC